MPFYFRFVQILCERLTDIFYHFFHIRLKSIWNFSCLFGFSKYYGWYPSQSKQESKQPLDKDDRQKSRNNSKNYQAIPSKVPWNLKTTLIRALQATATTPQWKFDQIGEGPGAAVEWECRKNTFNLWCHIFSEAIVTLSTSIQVSCLLEEFIGKFVAFVKCIIKILKAIFI